MIKQPVMDACIDIARQVSATIENMAKFIVSRATTRSVACKE